MTKIETGVILIATALLMSCGGSDAPEVDKSIMPAADSSGKAANATSPATTPASSMTVDAMQAAPALTQSVPSPQMVSSAQTIPAAQAAKAMPGAGLNPAHGQPGHDCAIPVGAPLGSAPAASTAAPSIQTVPSAGGAPVAADPNAKLNPAHGQPGHDCAIPVGAPLKKS